jgi:hypothetical protein
LTLLEISASGLGADRDATLGQASYEKSTMVKSAATSELVHRLRDEVGLSVSVAVSVAVKNMVAGRF